MTTTQLANYDAMLYAINKAYEFDDIKVLRDQAAMLEAAARVAGNTQAEDRCYEIRRRAERKAAMIYDSMEKANRGRPSGKNCPPNGQLNVLGEMGVEKQRMSEWRKLASTPKAQFDKAFAGGGRPSIAEITGKKKPERSAQASTALWVWGRVLDFERNGILATSPKVCFSELDDFQVDDLRRLGPKIIKWLNAIMALAEKE